MKGIFERSDLKETAIKRKGFRPFVPRFHMHMELIYVLHGEIRVRVDGVSHTLKQGEMSVCFPYLIHSYEEAPDAEFIIVLFAPETAGAFAQKVLQYKPVSPIIQNAQPYLTTLEKLVATTTRQEEEAEPLCAAYITTLVGEILLSVPMVPVEHLGTSAVQRILMYCSEHYSENISIRQTADAIGLSESYVTKIFSSKVGCTFRSYINSLRVSDAKKLLQDTDRKITDIMLSCGYDNQSSFNSAFREETGMTPREYRSWCRKG